MLKTHHIFEEKLGINVSIIQEFCQQWHIQELDVFGSAVRSDFTSESDLDFLVTFEPETKITLFDLETMENQLKAIFKREVDLVPRQAIERSHNWIRRQNILNEAEVLYVKG